MVLPPVIEGIQFCNNWGQKPCGKFNNNHVIGNDLDIYTLFMGYKYTIRVKPYAGTPCFDFSYKLNQSNDAIFAESCLQEERLIQDRFST